jgi:hypothetical protein
MGNPLSDSLRTLSSSKKRSQEKNNEKKNIFSATKNRRVNRRGGSVMSAKCISGHGTPLAHASARTLTP